MTFAEKLIRWQIANRLAEYRRCRNAPACRFHARKELRREIANLREYMRDRGDNRYRAPDKGYCLEIFA